MKRFERSTLRDLILFFVIAFAWSWSLNIPRALASRGILAGPDVLMKVLGDVAVFGPLVAALIMTGIRSGKVGVKALLSRGWDGRFRKTWLIPCLLLMPVAGALTILILRLTGRPIDWEYGLSPAMIVPIGLMIWLIGAVPEEYGWRGYALNRLMEGCNPLVASTILGLLWSLWHLPLHFIQGTTQAAIPIWQYWLQTVLLSLFYTWLHLGTGGSVLVASLFHAMGNITGATIPYWTSGTGRWISFVILLIPAVLYVVPRLLRGDRQEHLASDVEDVEE